MDDTQEGYGTFGEQGVLNQLSGLDIFMLSATTTVQFPFGDRKALVSINSNCSRHMTGFYDLLDIKPCDVQVNGAFEQGSQGSATHSGMLQLGQLFFEDAVFVPGLRETIISLGQLDAQGCSTEITKGKMEVYSRSFIMDIRYASRSIL